MNKVLKECFDRQAVQDESGNWLPLHSETKVIQCEFLQEMMEKCDASSCVEIGLAYGISSLAICEVLARKQSPRFISIDPFQAEWKDVGLLNLKKAGYLAFTEFHRDFSYKVLPRLLDGGLSIDFAYIDTTKVFDTVLVDAFYISRLLRVGGIMVFDDCIWPGVKRVARCVASWPHFEVVGKCGESKATLKRKLVSSFANALPRSQRAFRRDLLVLDEQCGTNALCVAFKKTAEDTRPWNWHADF